MPADEPSNLPVPRDPRSTALARRPALPQHDRFPLGMFCASPTVLQAINDSLHRRGLPTLWVMPDGSIGPTDPLILRMECDPYPFVC